MGGPVTNLDGLEPPMTSKVIHESPLRESAALRVEILKGRRIRTGLWRRSASSVDPDDFTLTAGFALSIEEARELRSALGLAISTLEADDAQ